jgi:SNF2 family DNA or RNA helicase
LGFEAGKKETLTAADAIALSSRVTGETDVRIDGDVDDFYAAGDLEPRLEVDDEGNYSVWFSPSADKSEPSSRGETGARVDASAVLRAWERGDEFAPLVDGGFGKLPLDWLTRYGDRIAGLLAAREAKEEASAPTAGWAMADLAALCEALDHPPPPGFDRLRALLEDFEGIGAPELPEDLSAELRDYQRDGVAWLSFLQSAHLGGLLADDMGLGKTIQTLCALRGRTLVVAPTSVLHNWAAEIEKFRPSLSVNIYHGASRTLDPDADVTLTTYAILRLDVDLLIDQSWETVVIDEAQAIKNPESQVARAAYRFESPFKIALTGTPVENRVDDLWSQFHFLNPGLLFGRSEFQDRFVKPIAAGDEQAAAALRERIRPFVLRRLKQDVASELPPRTDVVLRCELDKDERRVYDAVRAATQEQVVSQLGSGANVMKILEALLRLRQAACHPALVPGQAEVGAKISSKIGLLLETLDEAIAEGHKALVFSQWTSLLDLVAPHLQASGFDHVRLDGSTRNRGSVVDRFQDPDGPPVMLISLRAGGTGLNLTAADHVFLLDPWWNPAVEDQAADRAHRIGQDKPVLVHRLVARDTVEERILALQDRKRKLAETAVGQTDEAAQVTRDELLALLD